MQNLIRSLIAVFVFCSFGAMADQDLKVVSRNYSEPMKCKVQSVNDGYRDDHFSNYMFCNESFNVIMKRIQGEFQAIIKIEGLDGLAINLLNHQPQTLGDDESNSLNIKVIGVK